LFFYILGFIKEFVSADSNQEFVRQVKRILYQTHINVDDVLTNNIDIHLIAADENGRRESVEIERLRADSLGMRVDDRRFSRSTHMSSRTVRCII
jgi:hypothetical protein